MSHFTFVPRSVLLVGMMAFGAAPALAQDSGITVPEGFKATVFADDVGYARHLAVHDNGVVYVALRRQKDGSGVVALRDGDGDGRADETTYFGNVEGTGIGIHDGYLYFGTNTEIVRWKLDADSVTPVGDKELVVGGFARERQHATKPMAFDDAGNMYVTVGAPSNACQREMRTPGSPGKDPCPQLEMYGGIWKYSATDLGQQHRADARYATGIRNGLAIDFHPGAGKIVFATHGRDDLHRLFPAHYTVEENAVLPSEEVHIAQQGGNYGWPYSYYDHVEGARMQAPEYGGDGQMRAKGDFIDPAAAIPGHWAPNDLVIYTANSFPAKYQGGAFIAFHGSWNRAPLPQDGYRVVFLPMAQDGSSVGEFEVFADGFKGAEVLDSPSNAVYRPTGVAVGPDGALYVADSVKGRIWKITYEG